MDKQYNLRSTKRDSIEIPVQVLCNYSENFQKFMGNTESNQAQLTSGKNSDSVSDLDCSGLMVASHDDLKHAKMKDNSNPVGTSIYQQSSMSSGANVNVHAMMNQQILNQLSKLGQGLNAFPTMGKMH